MKLSKTQQKLILESTEGRIYASSSWGRGPAGGSWSMGTRDTQAYRGLKKLGLVADLQEPKSTYSTSYHSAAVGNLSIFGVEFVGALTDKGQEVLTSLQQSGNKQPV